MFDYEVAYAAVSFKMREVYACGWVCFFFSRADSGHGSVGTYQDRMHYLHFDSIVRCYSLFQIRLVSLAVVLENLVYSSQYMCVSKRVNSCVCKRVNICVESLSLSLCNSVCLSVSR